MDLLIRLAIPQHHSRDWEFVCVCVVGVGPASWKISSSSINFTLYLSRRVGEVRNLDSCPQEAYHLTGIRQTLLLPPIPGPWQAQFPVPRMLCSELYISRCHQRSFSGHSKAAPSFPPTSPRYPPSCPTVCFLHSTLTQSVIISFVCLLSVFSTRMEVPRDSRDHACLIQDCNASTWHKAYDIVGVKYVSNKRRDKLFH